MNKNAETAWRTTMVGLAVLAAGVVFVIDRLIELGVAVGVLYVIVVGLVYTTGRTRWIWGAAGFCTLLTVLGYLASPSGGDAWKVLANRGLALMAIWLTAHFSVRSLAAITERTLAERRLRGTVESALDAIVTIDQQGLITDWNSRAEHTFGWSREEAVGRTLSDLIVPPQFRASHVQGLEHFRKTGEAPVLNQRLELTALRRGGGEFPIELTIAFVPMGDRCEFSAFVRDISERKRQENELKQYAAELERSNKELADFAYVVSHDLKAPMRGIDNLVGWIANDCEAVLPDASKRHLRQLQQRVNRLEHLLDDMLAFSRAGREMGDVAEVDSGELVRGVVELLDPPEGFVVEVGRDLPTLTAHKTRLEQVFRNLIGNAIKHHDRSDGRVTVSSTDQGPFIEFCVADDGPGIAEEFHERVFRLFQTLKPRDEVEGSGMGLAVVKKVVESQGGRIEVESSGRGTTFRFTWPRRYRETEPPDAE